MLDYPPVFIIGMPRSGTTIVFEKYVQCAQIGWLSNYSEMIPGFPAANLLCRVFDNRILSMRGRKKQYGSVKPGNRYLPQPVEAYAFWDKYARHNFSVDFLLNEKASNAEIARVCKFIARTLYYQNKSRFVTKLTGPGRIRYLKSIFPEAKFIHVIRDGRAVIGSLMKVDFWRAKGGYDAPFWSNGITNDDLAPWITNKHPAILAAIQWKKIVSTIRQDSSELNNDQYIEMRYEDFITDPDAETKRLYKYSGLITHDINKASSSSPVQLSNMNRSRVSDIDEGVLGIIEKIMHDTLRDTGYDV